MLQQKIFGLDISDYSIEAILLSKTFGKAKIVAYARTILRGEIVKNGVVKKPDKLAEQIKKLLASAKPQSITSRYCIVSIPEAQVFSAIFKLPAGLKHSEIRNTIPYKAEEIIPFKSSEVYFDFKTIAVRGTSQEVFYAAAPIKVVDGYLAALEAAGLTAVAFDVESVSLARALIDPATDIKQPTKRQPGQAVLLMDIGARTTNLNIFDRNGIRGSLSINVAGNRFTKAVAAALRIDLKQANEAKIKAGFDPKQQRGRIAMVLQKEFRRIIDETKKFLDYYDDETDSQIDSILLAGGSSLLPQLPTYLSENLGVPVSLGNPLRKVVDPRQFVRLKSKAVLFANVIGLGLRPTGRRSGADDINLLPELQRRFSITPRRQDKAGWRKIYIGGASLLVAIVILLTIIGLRQLGVSLWAPPRAPEYTIQIDPDLNLQVLDELRQEFAASPAPSFRFQGEPNLLIQNTPVGYLNVRQGPGVNFPKVGEVDSATTYIELDEQDDWYLIEYAPDQQGWVSASYVDKLE